MKRISGFVKKILVFLTVIIVLVIVSVTIFVIQKYQKNYRELPTNSGLLATWRAKDYQKSFAQTTEILERRPNDANVRALHGFAAYYLSSAQTNEVEATDFLDDSIVSLRKAIYIIDKKDLAQVYYILGKAYYQKGYFYYDLSLKYLNKVFEMGGKYSDLNKFRGMAFSQLNEDEKAIEAFTQALTSENDEFLLYALAKSYMNVNNWEKAKMYLTEASEKAKDIMLKLNCKAKLAEIYLSEKNLEKARNEYISILAIDETYADAYYGLGVIYEQAGDLLAARAEWRKALRANPLHSKAIEKMR